MPSNTTDQPELHSATSSQNIKKNVIKTNSEQWIKDNMKGVTIQAHLFGLWQLYTVS